MSPIHIYAYRIFYDLSIKDYEYNAELYKPKVD